MKEDKRKTPLDDEFIEPHMCDLDLRLYVLGHLPFFSELPTATIKEINQHFIEHGYAADEIIYLENSMASRLFVVADGNVTLMRHTMAGKDVMLDILQQGEFFGSMANPAADTYFETARAHTPVCTLSIKGDEFSKIMSQHASVALKVVETMAMRLRAAQEMVQLLSVSSVEQRLAKVLLKLGEKFGEENKAGKLIQVPLGRADLAELVGTTTETASRVTSQLQKMGLIRTGRRWIAIADELGLKAFSEG